jgi:hypothetical protein
MFVPVHIWAVQPKYGVSTAVQAWATQPTSGVSTAVHGAVCDVAVMVLEPRP